jgi:3D (Asp-Asp-Asp) domain-containing protein
MEAAFCVATLEDALARHGKPELFNTDQGSQFTGAAFTSVLIENGIAISMHGKGAWRDNVFVERLWRSVKYEEVYLRAYETVSEARASIGRYLADQGVMTIDQVNMPAIRAWLAANPQRQNEVLDSNPSVVFFREAPLDDPAIGPKGAMGVPITAGRSIAIDPKFLKLGAPMFLSTTAPGSGLPLQRLVVAQDTGGAIRGPIRADLFFGYGAEAGTQAGMMKYDGEMWLLWPKAAPPPQ